MSAIEVVLLRILLREILDYFENAIHLGLTATPKETKYVSNIDYFNKPVYTYSLKQGIEDKSRSLQSD